MFSLSQSKLMPVKHITRWLCELITCFNQKVCILSILVDFQCWVASKAFSISSRFSCSHYIFTEDSFVDFNNTLAYLLCSVSSSNILIEKVSVSVLVGLHVISVQDYFELISYKSVLIKLHLPVFVPSEFWTVTLTICLKFSMVSVRLLSSLMYL